MSRLRTGHGPDDWEELPPFEAEFALGLRQIGGTMIEGRKAPSGLAQLTPAETARRTRRSEEMKLERVAKRLERAS